MSLVERISSQYFDTLSDDSMRQIFKKMETDPRKSVALASTCSRMRALGAEMRFPLCLLLTAPSEEHLLPSFKFNVEYKARIFHAVEVHCKTTSLGSILALHTKRQRSWPTCAFSFWMMMGTLMLDVMIWCPIYFKIFTNNSPGLALIRWGYSKN